MEETETIGPDAFIQKPRAPITEPTPNDPPWNSLLAVAFWITTLILMLFVPALCVLPYLLRSGIVDNAEAKAFLTSDPTAVLITIGAVIPVHILTFVLGWLLVTNLNRYPFWKTLGVQWGGLRIWHLAAILVGFFVLGGVVGYLLPEQDTELSRILKTSRTVVYLVAFLATFTAPIAEELVFRGILYSALQRSAGVYPAILIVTGAFAGVHYFQYWGSPGTLILITVLSLVLTLVRWRTGNLLPCIVLHFVFNGLQSLRLVLDPYIPQSAADPQTVSSFIHHIF